MALIASSSSSSMASSSASTKKKYDVFLSFRGEDTRYGITSHIYTALREKRIETYIDENSLERGDEISPALLAAIERSKISVIVLSEDYASSSWCLSELVHIHKCRREQGQKVLPVFYEVDPSNVRKQDQGSYRDSMEKHEKNPKFKAETIEEWRFALKASADLAGIHYSRSNRSESALVKEVVEVVMKEMGRPVIPHDDFKGLIGMENHFNKLEAILSNDSPRVCIVGIWGMPGIGKTTIADAVFSRLFPRFESYYFLKNVREGSEKHGLERLRDELIARLLGDEKLNPGILPNPTPEHAKDRLRQTKVLLVLDDVSERKQLDYLVGDQFYSGSRIIVTTRDEGVLRGTNIVEADIEKYEVELLSFEESLLLFNVSAFRENSSPPEFKELSSKAVQCVGGNPLAITVLGSHLRSLRNPSKQNWEMELEKLREFSHADIQKVLRVSFEGLGKTEKKIFLDISCFFKGKRRRIVENVLNGCNFFASTGIDDLIDKSLVTMDGETNKLQMHDLVQQMGRQIVREESEDPSNRSRLWNVEDVCHIFNNDAGTRHIEGIFLNAFELNEDVHLKPTVFKSMESLRLLIIYDISPKQVFKLYLEDLEYLPQSLRYLEWRQYHKKIFPTSFNPRNLVELKLPCSQIEQLWHGTKNLGNLKGLNLRHSINLTQLPDLSLAKNLEKLNLENCTSLLLVPWQILQNLNRLHDLNLSNCHKLKHFPDKIDARELTTLSLDGCVNLKTIPEIVSRNLRSLYLQSTAIASVPSSIGSINTLSELVLFGCERLVHLPSSISKLHLLKTLSLGFCSSLNEFPELPVNIEKLNMRRTAIEDVPTSSIERCSRLHTLDLGYCEKIKSLPNSIFELTSLVSLDLSYCSNLKNLPEISSHVESNLEDLQLGRSGIRYLPSSIGNLTKVRNLSLYGCRNLEFISNLMSRLTNLYIQNCRKIKRVSQLPFSLSYLNATGCTSLEVVAGSTSSPLRESLWKHDREVHHETFDISLYQECLKLKPSALAEIIAGFQLKVLHMATQYIASNSEIESYPAITTCYAGEEIPEWFNFIAEHSNDWSGSVPLPAEQQYRADVLGFALCVVVAGKNCTVGTDISCEMKFRREGKSGGMIDYPDGTSVCSAFGTPQNHMVFPVSNSNQVVMWYRHLDISSLREGDAKEVAFEFSIIERPDEPSKAKLLRCGVHMILRNDDLKELSVVCGDCNRLIEVNDQDDDDDDTNKPEIRFTYHRKKRKLNEGIQQMEHVGGSVAQDPR